MLIQDEVINYENILFRVNYTNASETAQVCTVLYLVLFGII
jgi:hypothetical protein